MAIPHIGGLSDKVVSVRHSDVSRAASTYLAAPRKGKIVRAHAALEAATTGASTLTLKINGNDVTSGSLTLGITAGTTTSLDLIDASPCTDDSNRVYEGDTIELASNGNAVGTAAAELSITIRDVA
jgi:hypothetical protein